MLRRRERQSHAQSREEAHSYRRWEKQGAPLTRSLRRQQVVPACAPRSCNEASEVCVCTLMLGRTVYTTSGERLAVRSCSLRSHLQNRGHSYTVHKAGLMWKQSSPDMDFRNILLYLVVSRCILLYLAISRYISL